MLTKLTLKNFKRFRDCEIELGSPVVFVGPNNSGKSTALQALTVWYEPVSQMRGGRMARGASVINRKSLLAVPVSRAELIWRNVLPRDEHADARPFEIAVAGISSGQGWRSSFRFEFVNSESLEAVGEPPPVEADIRLSMLPAMSGLAESEFLKQTGEIEVLIGQGRTAEVLRNLCWRVLDRTGGDATWQEIGRQVERLFGIRIGRPSLEPTRSEIRLDYQERNGATLDLASAGRGFHQILLLLAYLATSPETILLLDEPDAHLEILRQRQTYQLLTDFALRQKSQLIIATHSEVLLNEASGRDLVVAFLGQPHRIDGRGAQVLKSLREIGFEQYYQAEQRGWVLHLEGSTDLAILTALARLLEHPVLQILEQGVFIDYVQDQANLAVSRFAALKEAKPDLQGFALFDRREREFPAAPAGLELYAWRRCEIENYICQPETLRRWAQAEWGKAGVMERCLRGRIGEEVLSDLQDRYWLETKASTQILEPVLEGFYRELGSPELLTKSDYHLLARYVPVELIDPEIRSVLNHVQAAASASQPVREME